jgi:hypothetical protein
MTLKNLFHSPDIHTVSGVNFAIYKLAFDQFDDALLLGTYIAALDKAALASPIDALQALKDGTPERAALERLLAGCLALADDDSEPRSLTPADVAAMPIVTLVEAIGVMMEVNLDFFIRTLPTLAATAGRLMQMSTGLGLRSNSSAPATTSSTSAATASPNSGAI